MAGKKAAAGAPATAAITKWDEELAKQAADSAAMEANAGGGQFFSVKGGVLTWNDAPVPGNQMGVVILDSILENTYYPEKFDPDNIASPSCFAFGRDDKTMVPHANVMAAGTNESDKCLGCPMNEWASADTGKGKACKNTRRLALVPAGTFNAAGKFEPIDDLEHYLTTPVGFMKLPVTSVKGYAGFVKQVAGALKRPPHGLITKVKVVADAKTQFKVVFEALSPLGNQFLPNIMKRRDEVMATIDFPYQPREEKPAGEKPAAPKGRGAKAQARKY